MSLKSSNTMSAPVASQLLDREAPGRDTTGTAPTARAHAISCGVSPTTRMCSGATIGQAAPARAFERERHQRVPVGGIVAERATTEVAPEVEVFELDPRAALEVPGQQSDEHVVAAGERVEQGTNARHHRFRPSPGQLDFLSKTRHVALAQLVRGGRPSSVRPARAATSARMLRSVRPATGMPSSASAWPTSFGDMRGSSPGDRRRR